MVYRWLNILAGEGVIEPTVPGRRHPDNRWRLVTADDTADQRLRTASPAAKEPTWELLLDAARRRAAVDRRATFTRADLIADVQAVDPDRQRDPVSPVMQSMTINAPATPHTPRCGKVFRRVDRGVYVLDDGAQAH